MRTSAALLLYLAIATVSALFLGMLAGGLSPAISAIALLLGAIGAVAAFWASRAQVSPGRGKEESEPYGNSWMWLVVGCFALFALRSFFWLYYYDGDAIRIQSPNNLGDLGLHLSYIKTFASGVALWPDSPLFPFSKLRYPAGVDLFNGVLTSIGFDLRQQLVITGLIASGITCYMFYRWAGAFGIAGFLCNGGVAGYQFLTTMQVLDYQGGTTISWKSIPLSMFVTQRGLLYAIPAGLLLLWQWRAKFGDDATDDQPLPGWIEYLLYATMPLFHVHTFIALNVVVVMLFLARPRSRRPLLILAATAFLPAAFFGWLITDDLAAKKVFEFHWGWTQTGTDDFAMPFFLFWFVNFGLFLPLMLALYGTVFYDEWRSARWRKFELSMDMTLLASALVIFVLVLTVKMAPWEWDNNKVLIWAYFIVLPVLWKRLLKPWPLVACAGACGLLFFSGFISLLGGLAAGKGGFEFASRAEIDVVGAAIRSLPLAARFASFPTYNHPLLLNGRKVVCGYPGHLWTQGLDYAPVENSLQSLMLGQGDWKQTARSLKARYLYWGEEEKRNYPASTRPWETTLPIAAKGAWGTIYDFGASP